MDLTKLDNEELSNFWKSLCNTLDNSEEYYKTGDELENTWIYKEMMYIQSEATSRNVTLNQ